MRRRVAGRRVVVDQRPDHPRHRPRDRDLAAAEQRHRVEPEARAATAGNSASRSSVTVKMQLTIASGVELVAGDQLPHQLPGHLEDRVGLVGVGLDRAPNREQPLFCRSTTGGIFPERWDPPHDRGPASRAVPYPDISGKRNSASLAALAASVAAGQHGVISRAQLRGLGATDAIVDHWLAGSRLHPVFRGVFALGHPAIDDRGRAMAASFACGRGTVLSHLSAAFLLGLRDRAPRVVDVIAPRQTGRRLDGIRPHFVPRPGPAEVVVRDRVRCTSPARTLVDLAGTLGARPLRDAVERAATLGALDLGAIDLAMAKPRRGSPLLRTILEGWRRVGADDDRPSPLLRSELEARRRALIAEDGLPPPLCNQILVVDGNRIEVDMVWPRARLIVEVDGRAYHRSPDSFERDRSRDRSLQLDGYRVLRVTADQIRREPEALLSAIRRLLGIR